MIDNEARRMGERLGELRRARNLSQAQLCKRCNNMSKFTLQKIERGAVSIMRSNLATALTIARALGVSVETLVDCETHDDGGA